MSYIPKLTAREIAAFKAGSWSSLPIDYVIENYGIPYAKKHFGAKAFYEHINKMPYRRRTTAVASRSGKYKIPSPRYAIKSPPKMLVGVVDNKVATAQLNASSLSAHNTQDLQLYTLNQGVEMGQRVGRVVRAKYLEINTYARNLNNTNILYLRMVVFIDKKPQVGTTNTNLFRAKGDANVPLDYGISPSMDTIRNPINNERWTVLSDRFYRLPANITANNGQQGRIIKYRINVDRNIHYLNAAAGTSVDEINPNMYLKYWIEKEDGTAGTSLADVSCDVYQYFNG